MVLDEEATSVGSRVGKVCCVAIGVLVLSGCAGEAGADGSTTPTGALELAVSETCVPDSARECVAVIGEHVLVSSADFVRAGVESVTVAADQPGNAVDVTFSSEGAAVLGNSTAEVAQAGDDARLVIKVGNEVIAAVAVAQPQNGDHVQMALPAEMSPDEFIERLGQA
jgi:hypothetical protein